MTRYIPRDPKGRERIELGAHTSEAYAWLAIARYTRRDPEDAEARGWTVWARSVLVAAPEAPVLAAREPFVGMGTSPVASP